MDSFESTEEVIQFFREKQKGVSRVRKFWELLKESVLGQILLALMFGGVTVYLLATGQQVPGELWAVNSAMIGFYFGSKTQRSAK